MSDTVHRRRVPTPAGSGGRSPRTRRPAKQQAPRRYSGKNRSRPSRILTRSFSEPTLRRGGDDDDRRRPPMSGIQAEESDPIVYLPQIRSTVFASSPSLFGFCSPSSPSPVDYESYKKEAKVVISVSVEGSPGPVRTMVKLGSNVEEIIKIVVDKYCEEGRTPKLDGNAAFELHQSHFSLQCLEKTEIIGDIGSRSFYLRKRGLNDGVSKPYSPENVLVGPSIASSNLIQSFIARKMGKIVRRTRKIWNVLVCNQ